MGGDVVNELVDWLNTVDLTYRSELKEHNEINLRRVEAVIRSEMGKVESKIGKVETKIDIKISALRGEMKVEIASLRADLLKWMFVFWATTALVTIGLG